MVQRSEKVALYARVSTSHNGQNPEVQLAELRKYAQDRDWIVVSEVVDHGFSGGTNQRPGLRRLATLIEGRSIDAVVVVKLDRLFRSLRHMVTTLALWEASGVKFISLRDAIDQSTPQGRLLTGILSALAEFERDLCRERVMAGLAFAKANGKRLGRRAVHNPDEIRALRAKGLSYRQIQSRLNAPAGVVARALKGARKTLTSTAPQAGEIADAKNDPRDVANAAPHTTVLRAEAEDE